MLHEIKELSRFLTELSVCDYFFIQQSSTTVGLASLLAAIDLVEGNWKNGAFQHFLVQVGSVARCDYNSHNVMECKARLQDTYIQGGFYQQQRLADEEKIGGEISPVCVSGV